MRNSQAACMRWLLVLRRTLVHGTEEGWRCARKAGTEETACTREALRFAGLGASHASPALLGTTQGR